MSSMARTSHNDCITKRSPILPEPWGVNAVVERSGRALIHLIATYTEMVKRPEVSRGHSTVRGTS